MKLRLISFRSTGQRAFTLLEMLMVMGVIAILLVALIPAVSSLSKSSGRKAAISNLLSALEEARSRAIKDGQPTYLVFPAFSTGSQTDRDRYNHRSYAIFQEDSAATPSALKQLTPWRTLPTGISLRSGSINYLAKTTTFPFTPLQTTGQFPAIKFNANGEVEASSTPSATTGTIQFGIFEGFVDAGGDRDSSAKKFTETITVTRLTGRATYTP